MSSSLAKLSSSTKGGEPVFRSYHPNNGVPRSSWLYRDGRDPRLSNLSSLLTNLSSSTKGGGPVFRSYHPNHGVPRSSWFYRDGRDPRLSKVSSLLANLSPSAKGGEPVFRSYHPNNGVPRSSWLYRDGRDPQLSNLSSSAKGGEPVFRSYHPNNGVPRSSWLYRDGRDPRLSNLSSSLAKVSSSTKGGGPVFRSYHPNNGVPRSSWLYRDGRDPRTSRSAHIKSTLATLLATAALTGCMVGPRYKAPTAPTPPAFKEAPDAFKETADWHVATPADEIPRGAWWTVFHDSGLDVLEPQVETANQDLKAADANLRAARASIRVRNASRFPTVGASPSIGGERLSANRPYFNAANANNGVADLSLPLQLNYEVDLWGRIRRNIAAAREEAQATAADRQNVLLSLQAELAFDYFQLRAADAEQKLLNDTVAQYENALRVTNNRFTGGIAPKSDVTQAQTQLQAARVQASDVASQRAQFEHAIATLIGQPPSALSLPPSPLDLTPPTIPPGLPATLLERRPDIAAEERRTAVANEQIGIARAAYFPSLVLSGAAGFESTSLVNLFNPSSFVYALGPALGQTFFDGGRRRGLSDQALAGYDRTVANYRQTVLTAYQQVEDSLVSLRVLSQEAEQQRQATAAARESQRIFNNRYVGGVDTYLQVITAQTTALNNQRNDIDILRRRMDSTVLLIKALGGGWDRTQLPPP